MGAGAGTPVVIATSGPWVPVVVVGVVAVVAVILVVARVVRRTHPAGPVPGRRRHATGQEALAVRLSGGPPGPTAAGADRAVRRRLRHLERSLQPNLSESQRHWFDGNLTSGRYRQALESLAGWTVASHGSVPDPVRDDFLAIADSLGIRGTVLGILHREPRERRHALHTAVDGRPGIDIPRAEFEELVGDAIDSLPEEFLSAMTNVSITVEEEAEGGGLFGLYTGVPLTSRYSGAWYANPDQIFIYRRTICEHCRTPAEVRDLVHTTVVHEIAHHFGISDQRLQELGWG